MSITWAPVYTRLRPLWCHRTAAISACGCLRFCSVLLFWKTFADDRSSWANTFNCVRQVLQLIYHDDESGIQERVECSTQFPRHHHAHPHQRRWPNGKVNSMRRVAVISVTEYKIAGKVKWILLENWFNKFYEVQKSSLVALATSRSAPSLSHHKSKYDCTCAWAPFHQHIARKRKKNINQNITPHHIY